MAYTIILFNNFIQLIDENVGSLSSNKIYKIYNYCDAKALQIFSDRIIILLKNNTISGLEMVKETHKFSNKLWSDTGKVDLFCNIIPSTYTLSLETHIQFDKDFKEQVKTLLLSLYRIRITENKVTPKVVIYEIIKHLAGNYKGHDHEHISIQNGGDDDIINTIINDNEISELIDKISK